MKTATTTMYYQRNPNPPTCFRCKRVGHISRNCDKPRWCKFCKSESHDSHFCVKKEQINNVEEKNYSYYKVSADPHFNSKDFEILVDCGATAHVITDIEKFSFFENDFDPNKTFIELADGSKNNNIALKKGTAKVTLEDIHGNQHDIHLKSALYVPSFNQNILSVQAAVAKGSNIEFSQHGATLRTKDGTKFKIKKRGKLYFLNKCSIKKINGVAVKHDLSTWHKIFGHCNIPDILKMESCVDGMNITPKNHSLPCETCTLGKMPNVRSREPDEKATTPLELIHCDLAGPVEPISMNGFKYVLTFTDDYSGFIMTYFLPRKSDTITATKQYLADTASIGNIKRLRSDNGSEFTSKEFSSLLVNNKIRHEFSSPYSPHQNGTAERQWRTLFDMSRCMLLESNLNHDLWPYALLTATYIRNRCFNNRLHITPYEAFHNKKPDVGNMNIFGTTCYAYVQNKKKLDPRAEKGIFVGYDKYSPAYFVFFCENKSVKKIRQVTFTNKFMNNKGESTQEVFGPENYVALTPTSFMNNEGESTQEVFDSENHTQEVFDSENHVDIPPTSLPDQSENEVSDRTLSNTIEENQNPAMNQENNSIPLTDETLIHSNPAIEDTHSLYPPRERRPPAYLKDYVTGEEFSDSDCVNSCATKNIPVTYEEAINSPEAENWKTAMEKELYSLQENNTYTLTNLPENKNVVGGKWVFSIKEGEKLEYKARYVAKGYSQIKNVDYYETYAPTTKMTTIRMLMQLGVQYNLIIHQMDVKSAYLNAEIDCDIFVEQPQGYKIPGKEKLVWQLNKSLYGLKQSGKNWNDLLKKEFLDEDFNQGNVDPCMFCKNHGTTTIIILVWVDDILIAASDWDSLIKVKRNLMKKFQMTDLGQIKKFLGINFHIDSDMISMDQSGYTNKLLERFDMLDCKPRQTPCEQKLSFSGDAEPFDQTTYREAIGSLIYLSTCTRPDISWVVNKLSQYNQNPTVEHWKAVKHIFRYLKATINFSISFRKCEDNIKIIGFTDADWGGSEDRRSTSGYCFSLSERGPVIAWKSQKQPTVALSTCEAEYVAMTLAVQEAEYLMKLIKEMDSKNQKLEDATIFSDNQSALCVAKNPISSQRMKHIDIKYHFIRNKINSGKIKVEYVPTEKNNADCFTKPLGKI